MPFLIAVVIARVGVAGQTLLPGPTTPQHLTVSTSASALTAAPGSKVSLFVDVTPKPGIHVYAPGAKDYLPIAVTLKLLAGASVGKTAYPKSEMLMFEKELVPVFQKPFRLAHEVTIAQDAKPGTKMTFNGVVDYQACDDTICFKPATAPVAWTLHIK